MLHCSNGVVQPNDYVPKFGKISVKFSVLGVVCPYRFSPMGLQFGMEEWTEWTFGDRSTSPWQISPHRWNVSTLRGEKAQNRPLSNLITGALHRAHFCR